MPHGARATEDEKWNYILCRLCELKQSLTQYFADTWVGVDEKGRSKATNEQLELIESLLFDNHLVAESDLGFSAYNEHHLYENSHGQDPTEVIQLPDRPYRDFIWVRGTGLSTRFDEAGLERCSYRRDADIDFIRDGCEFNSLTFNGWPEGWQVETPMVERIPFDHCIPNPISRGWTARWNGLAFLPEVAEKQVFLILNVAPLNAADDNVASIKVSLNGKASAKVWTPSNYVNGFCLLYTSPSPRD